MACFDLPRQEHEEFLSSVRGWKQLETVGYSVRPDSSGGDGVWRQALVTCLVRPDDPRPLPHLNVVP